MSGALQRALDRLLAGEHVGAEETSAAVDEIMRGEAAPSLIGGFLVALRLRGETVEQVMGAARAMRAHGEKVACGRSPLVDTCGTGGDGGSTFSVSTAAALVAAGAGAAVAKHGNRAASGRFGGADAFEALGVAIDLPAEALGRCLDEVGIAFLFARRLHPAMRHVAPVRAELKTPTIFNLLGPLTNPAGAKRQVVGVSSPAALRLVAGALCALGCEHALVLRGRDGLDEISLAEPTDVIEIQNGSLRELVVDASTFELEPASREAIRADSLDESVAAIREVLDGRPGPRASIVAANAGAALYVAGKAQTLADGARLALDSIRSGRALEVLERLAAFTQAQAFAGDARR